MHTSQKTFPSFEGETVFRVISHQPKYVFISSYAMDTEKWVKNYRAYGTLEAISNGANKQLRILIIITANTSCSVLLLVDVEDM